MEVFKEAVVGIQRIAVLGNAENPLHRFLWDDLQPRRYERAAGHVGHWPSSLPL